MSADSQSTDDADADSSDVLLGSITGTPSTLSDLLDEMSVGGGSEPVFGTLYFDIRDGVLTSLASVGANSAMSYATITEDGGIDDITLEQANGGDDDDGASVMFWVEELQSYLDLVGGGDDGSVTLDFRGDPTDKVAGVAEIKGGLNAEVYLPASAADVDKVPFGVTQRFNDDDDFLMSTPDDDDSAPGTFPTEIETTTEEMDRIVSVVDEADSPDIYPVKVEDAQFKIDLRTREASRDTVWGTLHGSDVTGPDVDAEFSNRFKKIAASLDGRLTLSTAPDTHPIAIVQKTGGKTLRYLIAPVQNAG